MENEPRMAALVIWRHTEHYKKSLVSYIFQDLKLYENIVCEFPNEIPTKLHDICIMFPECSEILSFLA